ncbi:MAG: bifunctional 3-deoxy-7-phosphoheptulonate synthase/chorismate mutase type II [Bacteroidetes bacterium]|nr:bifunctional 3-deoxy-7-phosphoheptulonate synthase/chorismate mutase type II [Bacteroidota bacterium]
MKIQALNTWITKDKEALIVAGPCGAETREQVLETAKGLAAISQVKLFRAGIWKPRTRPNSFEGVGEEGLKWLNEVQQQYKLKTTVEVANAQHVELALKYKVDVLWIGARTTVNPFSVQEIADAVKGVDIPVMIKNPIHADLHLWIGALERINNAGITKLAAIHRGFHFAGKSKYRNKPMWEIAIELKTLLPDLPIICDPSHIGGKRDLIEPIAQKALNLGMNGLMIETHPHPEKALSDAAQQITPIELSDLLGRLIFPDTQSSDVEFSNKLKSLRSMIDEVDDELINLLAKRLQIIEEIALYKKDQNITVFQLERWQEILRTRSQWAEKLGVSRHHIEKICQILHEESIRVQNEAINKKTI